MDEDDIGTYSIKTVDDPQTLNKTLYLRPPENILSQNELIDTWEKLSGKVLEKIHVRNDELLASMEGAEFLHQVAVCHFHHIFYEGCLTNFDIGKGCEEAFLLCPEVQYTQMDEYMKRYL